MKRLVVVLTVWAMGLVWAGTSVVLPAGSASAAASGIMSADTVSAGQFHACAVTTTGAVMCWGNNDYGELGNNSTTDSSVPVAVSGLSSGVVAVSSGWNYSCAVTTTGAVWCWGNNDYGQLGNNSTTDSSVPVPVTGLESGVAAVSTSLNSTMGPVPDYSTGAHSCAVTTAGAVWCWGTNQYGQLGNNTTTDSWVPVPVTGLESGAAQVSVNINFSCAVTTAGAAMCWGGNADGTLGDGTTNDSPVPVGVFGLGTGVAAISAGFGFACAVTTTGAAKCWGDNTSAELGNGTHTSSAVPVPVYGLSSGVAAISTGWWVACAVTTGGAVKCWGNGPSHGPVPVAVYGLSSGVATVSTGQNFSCVVTTTGRVMCWDANDYGQLGNGTTTDSSIPVYVVGFAAIGVAAVTRLSDFNRDGYTDLVARDAAGALWLYPGNGTGGFLARRQMGSSGWNIMNAIVTPGDVTGDDNGDIIAKDTAGRLWLYPGNNASRFAARRLIGSGGWTSYTITNAANMNTAGRPDLLARDSAGNLWLYPLSGNAVFGARTKIGTGWGSLLFRGPGDLSGDGRADILARNSAGQLLLYRGNGAGGVAAGIVVGSGGWSGMTALVTPGNWDRTSGNDVVARDASGNLWLYPGNNASGFAARRLIGSGGWQGMTYIG